VFLAEANDEANGNASHEDLALFGFFERRKHLGNTVPPVAYTGTVFIMT
jgi:hypothetical protein